MKVIVLEVRSSLLKRVGESRLIALPLLLGIAGSGDVPYQQKYTLYICGPAQIIFENRCKR